MVYRTIFGYFSCLHWHAPVYLFSRDKFIFYFFGSLMVSPSEGYNSLSFSIPLNCWYNQIIQCFWKCFVNSNKLYKCFCILLMSGRGFWTRIGLKTRQELILLPKRSQSSHNALFKLANWSGKIQIFSNRY